MITTHPWTGWYDSPPGYTGPPIYGDCETVVKGQLCKRPRYLHEHSEQAYPYAEISQP